MSLARQLAAAPRLWARERLDRQAQRDLLVATPRSSFLDSDTLALILMQDRLPQGLDLVVLVPDPEGFREANRSVFDLLAKRSVEVDVRAAGSPESAKALHRARALHLKGWRDLGPMRWALLETPRTVIRSYHGLITKAYRRLATTESRPVADRAWLWVKTLLLDPGFDARSITTDVERYFRAAAEDTHPDAFARLGYPRFDRAVDLVEATADPLVPPDEPAVKRLREAERAILYAPTHKDGRYSTSLFPFPDHDLDRLADALDEHEADLFVRMHVFEGSPASRDLFERERIHPLGADVLPSALEGLVHVDALVTDHSSIDMEFLPFDRPILYARDPSGRFDEIRGSAFQTPGYTAGPVVETMDAFLETLDRALDASHEGPGAADRAFVRRTFGLDRSGGFLDNLDELLREEHA